MARRVAYARGAYRDLDEIYEWIKSERGSMRAEAVVQSIERTIERVGAMPRMGRIRTDLEGAPRSFSARPWTIFYDIVDDGRGILVLRLIDGRRDVPKIWRS